MSILKNLEVINRLYPIYFHILALIFSLFALILSFWFEYFRGIKPCYFCTLQRYLFIFILSASSLGLIAMNTKWADLIQRILFAAFISSFIVAGYHVLVQAEFVNDFCRVNKVVSLNDFEALMYKQTSTCKNKSASLMGVSAPLINSIASGLMCTFFIFSCVKRNVN